jgi:hypothetical protein
MSEAISIALLATSSADISSTLINALAAAVVVVVGEAGTEQKGENHNQ